MNLEILEHMRAFEFFLLFTLEFRNTKVFKHLHINKNPNLQGPLKNILDE